MILTSLLDHRMKQNCMHVNKCFKARSTFADN